jgi:hypothetical protein
VPDHSWLGRVNPGETGCAPRRAVLFLRPVPKNPQRVGILRRVTQRRSPAIELGLRGPRRPEFAFRQPHISAIRFGAQKLLADEDVENGTACVPIDAAEAMYLLSGKAQARHLEEFGAEAFEDWLHVDLALDQRNRKDFQIYARTPDDARLKKYQCPLSSDELWHLDCETTRA